jgi:UDP-N-acetylmuramoyl-tripeptide--D-alanyl-D-alanine ligase
MRLLASEIARLTGGVLHGPEVEVDGASTDSREIHPGNLFVAVVAERDGHDFVADAVDRGALLHLTSQPPGVEPAIQVDDTVAALTRLASALRDRLPDRVIGVTGSVGKTTVKDLVAAALRTTYVTAASHRSHNNELGVPLSIVNAPDGTEAAVIEMGARGAGHIDHLCGIARPTVGVVSTVGLAHTELFGGIEGVIRAKGELIESLPASGVAVLNADMPEVLGMADRTDARVVTFGLNAQADVTATEIVLDEHLCPTFTLRSPWGSGRVTLPVRGHHQVGNALAAAAAVLAVDVTVEHLAEGLGLAELSPWRMHLVRRADGVVVLNDAYNANPTSMVAALEALQHLDARRRLAVLGPMAELGEHSDAAHREIALAAAELDIGVVAVAAPGYGPTVRHVADLDEVVDALGPLAVGDAVLLKGSRVAGLERLADRLVEGSSPRS